jgi:hypothetical protein
VIERLVIYGALAVVVLTILASALPRITPSLIALGLLVLLGRVVWWYTQ